MDYPKLIRNYNSVGDLPQESFKVQSMTSSGIMNFLQESEDNFVFGVKSESWGGEKDISNICSMLPRVSIQGEDLMNLGNVIRTKDGVFRSNILGKDGFEFFLLELFFWHDIS